MLSNDDRKAIWALTATLQGVYILILPFKFAVFAMFISAYASYKALNKIT